MKTIRAIVRIGDDRRLTMSLPPDVSPGEHNVVLVIDERPHTESASPPVIDFPSHDVGPWPDGFTAGREDLYGDDGR
jgi:hypothetical protein